MKTNDVTGRVGPGDVGEDGEHLFIAMELLEGEGWPIDDYRSVCHTIGREITWDPGGSGLAVDVDHDGALVVETDLERLTLHSGAVRHVR